MMIVHRDPRLWEDPDKFDPERWRPGQNKIPGSYFPFSYGPRDCIGPYSPRQPSEKPFCNTVLFKAKDLQCSK